MNFAHLPHRHKREKPGENDHPEKCPKCGRQLMERKGLFRRLTPISNALVVYGNCLACHSDDETVEEDRDHDCYYKDPLNYAIMRVQLRK